NAITLIQNGCTIYPDIDAMYKGKCDLLDNTLDEVQGCEFKITGTSNDTYMDDDISRWKLTINEIDWLVNMNECEQPKCIEEVIAFYQM
ncbi:hypothetical protein, partial [Klebsiella pneumoniae]|uniref:hypothetical protein n=1 Tax=Klebsiella pneumoniae TaxID=573 RepID=UPI00273210BF